MTNTVEEIFDVERLGFTKTSVTKRDYHLRL